MIDNYSLQDKVVQLFLKGQWQFSGRVEYINSEKLVLKSDMGSLVIYRENIIAAMVLDEKSSEDSIDEVYPESYKDSMEAREAIYPDDYRDDIAQENYYGSVIPSDMLIGEDDEPQVSFSMSGFENTKISGEINGPKQENGSDREKNSD